MKYRMHMKKSILLLLSACLSVTPFTSACQNPKTTATPAPTEEQAPAVVFNADSALASIQAQCAFGPRVPDSEAHRLCGDYIVEKFKSYGLKVIEQETTVVGWDKKRLPCRNIIASYRPELQERIAFAAHWDCRPWSDNDKDDKNHRTPVMGANDGASGIGVMVELARLMEEIDPAVGIDFLCFDMEDYGAPYWGNDQAPQDGSDWCLGSQYWANHPHVDGYTARYGVLLDMVGGKHATYYHEGFSLRYAADIVQRIWAMAQTVGAEKYFINEDGTWATDDHVSMNEIAGIPTVDIIPYHKNQEASFGPTWHTVNDTPENISTETLKAVGQTMVELIRNEK